MITITIQSDDAVPFNVTFQGRVTNGGTITWEDLEEVTEVGKSQRYGIDEGHRLIIMTADDAGTSNG